MADTDFQSFEEFWPYYLGEHEDRTCRLLHLVGTTGSVLSLIAMLVTWNPTFLFVAMLSGYGCAWIGHYVYEGNRPATFKHPLWSLRGDFKMWWQTLITRELALPKARQTA